MALLDIGAQDIGTTFHADLNEFVYEVAEVSGLLGICMTLDSGTSVEQGQSLVEVCSDGDASILRTMIQESLRAEYDALAIAWVDLRLCACRVGRSTTLLVLCRDKEQERRVLGIWKKRRGAWSLRLDDDGFAEEPSIERTGEGWRAEIPERMDLLLRNTQALFVELRAGEEGVDAQTAAHEFDSLTAEWAAYCDPSVVSFPMLLDSLRQCLSAQGSLRAEFFERMHELMAHKR